MKLDLLKLGLISFAVALAPAATVPSSSERSEIARAIKDLRDESFVVREQATRKIWKLGEAALPALRQVVDGDDPEAAVRGRGLLRKIELGILPDSSPLLIELVLRYDRGGIDERRIVLGEMRQLRAWRQILKLYALEEDEASLALLARETRGVAIGAAREALSSDKPDIRTAFSFLDMARPEPGILMAKASLHRVSGTLDEELRRALAAPDDTSKIHLWRYSLLCVAGRLDEAANEAAKAGMKLASGRLKMLQGDPVPWIKAALPYRLSIPGDGLEVFRKLTIQKWNGEKPNSEAVRKLKGYVKGEDEDQFAKELLLLFLAGEVEEGERQLVESDPSAAFYFFMKAGRSDEALKVFGLNSKKPDYTAWAQKRFSIFIDEPNREADEIMELGLLGQFLEDRGLVEELNAAYTEPLIKLAGQDQETFLRVCALLFSGGDYGILAGTIHPVLEAVAEFAGEDQIRWETVVRTLFSSQDRLVDFWNWLAVLDPALKEKERLEWMCKILPSQSRNLPDPTNERARFFELAWADIRSSERVAKSRNLELLINICRSSGDPVNFLRGIEIFESDPELFDEADPWPYGFKAGDLSVVGRWEEAADEWLKVTELDPGEPVYHARAAAALRKIGHTAAADDQEYRAELLALGNTGDLLECGQIFALSGDFDRADRCWNRAAAECTVDSAQFVDVTDYLKNTALLNEDWKVAASLSYAQLFRQALLGNSAMRLPPLYRSYYSNMLRTEADGARVFSRIDTDRSTALKHLKEILMDPVAETSLADYFFGPLRGMGLAKLHDELFEVHWKRHLTELERFPSSVNTRNSVAWVAARASRRIETARKILEDALDVVPREPAYLDTMAELYFAEGDRKEAMKFSAKSMEGLSSDRTFSNIQLIQQSRRFEQGKFPPK